MKLLLAALAALITTSALASPPLQWGSGGFSKLIEPSGLKFYDLTQLQTGTVDPSSSATTAPIGSLYLNTSTGKLYRKLDAGSSTNWAVLSGSNTGDVTIGTANGLSLAGQSLSLQLASGTQAGALSAADWTTFNGKQPAGNYLTALSSDVVATGPAGGGSAAATIQANVVSNSKLSQMAANTIKGNNTGSTANAADLTVAQVNTLLGDVLLSGSTMTGALTLPAGSAGSPSLNFTGALTSGLFGITNGLALSANGSEIFRVDSSGITTFGSTTSGAARINIQNVGDVTTGGLRFMNSTAAASAMWDMWDKSNGDFVINNNSQSVRYVFGKGGGFAASYNSAQAQAAIEAHGSDSTTAVGSVTLSTGNVNSASMAITNENTTDGNLSPLLSGQNSQRIDAGIYFVHDTHGASFAGHQDFYVSTGGVLSKALSLGTNKQPTFPYFAAAAPIITNSSGQLSTLALTNGQLLIGSTGAAPVAATITAGTGIAVTPGAGSLTIATSGASAATTVTITASTGSTSSSSNDVFLDPATAGGTITVTLHTAVGNNGQHMNFKCISTGTVILSGQTIEGDSAGGRMDCVTGNLQNLTIGSDNANWWVL